MVIIILQHGAFRNLNINITPRFACVVDYGV